MAPQWDYWHPDQRGVHLLIQQTFRYTFYTSVNREQQSRANRPISGTLPWEAGETPQQLGPGDLDYSTVPTSHFLNLAKTLPWKINSKPRVLLHTVRTAPLQPVTSLITTSHGAFFARPLLKSCNPAPGIIWKVPFASFARCICRCGTQDSGGGCGRKAHCSFCPARLFSFLPTFLLISFCRVDHTVF